MRPIRFWIIVQLVCCYPYLTAWAIDPGVIVTVDEWPPTRVDLPLTPGTHYTLSYPSNRIQVYRSGEWQFSPAVVATDQEYVFGQELFGDVNRDGVVRLDDLIAIRTHRYTGDSAYNIDGYGGVDDDDIVAARNALGSVGNNTLTVYLYAWSVPHSTSLADVQIQLLTDPDLDGTFAVAATVDVTVVQVDASTSYGLFGAPVTLTVSPAIAPLVFDTTTTVDWQGQAYDIVYGLYNSAPMTTHFNASQVYEQNAAQAVIVIGDGSKSPGSLNGTPLSSALFGPLKIHCGDSTITKTFEFDPFYNIDGYRINYGFDAAGDGGGIGDEVWFLSVVDPVPAEGTIELEQCIASKYLLWVLAEANSFSQTIAPPALQVAIVLFDENGTIVARIPTWLFKTADNHFGPEFIAYYSDWTKPIMFIDGFVSPEQHPAISPIDVSNAVYWDVVLY